MPFILIGLRTRSNLQRIPFILQANGQKQTQPSKIQWIPLLIEVNKIKSSIHGGGGMSDLWARIHCWRCQEELVGGDLDAPRASIGGGPGFDRKPTRPRSPRRGQSMKGSRRTERRWYGCGGGFCFVVCSLLALGKKYCQIFHARRIDQLVFCQTTIEYDLGGA
jgi:hypothetical protein